MKTKHTQNWKVDYSTTAHLPYSYVVSEKQETPEEAEANKKLIQATLQGFDVIKEAYLHLQKYSNLNIDIAVATDQVRASFRNYLSEATGIDSEEIQNYFETEARK